LELAKRLGKPVEIISADSRQVYRLMNIGTDKIDESIRAEIPHHQIDIIDPDEIYTAWQRQQECYQIIEEILNRWHIPMIVGGTGLYIDTIVYNFSMSTCEPDQKYRDQLEELEAKQPGSVWRMLNEIDPVEAAKNHPNSIRFIIRALEIYQVSGKTKTELMQKAPPRYPLLMIELQQDVQLGNKLIDERIGLMLKNWLVDEVKALLSMGYKASLTSLKTIDYKQTVEYIQGTLSLSEYIQSLQVANHQLAKKQRTWFRRYSKDAEKYALHKQSNKNIKYLSFYLPDYFS
jgi:tRNA dimethylallyltransferase